MPSQRRRCAVQAAALALACALPGPCAAAAALSPLAMSCTACHRPGVAGGSFVALDTLPAAAIEQSLRRFRDQPEPASIMSRFVKTMSDDHIHRLASELSAPP